MRSRRRGCSPFPLFDGHRLKYASVDVGDVLQFVQTQARQIA